MLDCSEGQHFRTTVSTFFPSCLLPKGRCSACQPQVLAHFPSLITCLSNSILAPASQRIWSKPDPTWFALWIDKSSCLNVFLDEDWVTMLFWSLVLWQDEKQKHLDSEIIAASTGMSPQPRSYTWCCCLGPQGHIAGRQDRHPVLVLKQQVTEVSESLSDTSRVTEVSREPGLQFYSFLNFYS